MEAKLRNGLMHFTNYCRFNPKWMMLAAICLFLTDTALAGPFTCGNHCFDTEIVSINADNACKEYTLKVSYSGECRYYGLSHFTVGIPCGEVTNASNSEGWPMELNLTDPTTGVYGFKVDDIEGFGEVSGPQEFTVTFTLCGGDDKLCEEELSCWAPTVAYKSGQCVDLETLEVNCQTLNGAIVPTDESCFGASDGRAEVSVDGGTAPFSFLWSNGSVAQNLEGVPAGDYSVVITDANGEEITLQTTISGPSAIVVDGTVTGSSCSGVSNGSIALTVQGGVAPYSFAWSNGEEGQQIDNLAAGAYSVTVTDGNGCTTQKSFAITSSDLLQLMASGSKISCGASNGTVDLTVSGGAAPYTFSWSNDVTTEDLEGLSAGWYFVTVTDANGCTATASARVVEETLELRSTLSRPTCSGGDNGSIDLTVTNGVSPFTFSWSNGQTTEDLTGISRGVYTVTVVDATGCERTASFYVSEPLPLSGDISVRDFNCGESTAATLDLKVTGGTSPYSFSWSTGDTAEDIAVEAEGTYQVTITDANGCTVASEFTYEMPEQPLALTFIKSDLSCSGAATGAIDLTVSGGQAPYDYQWSNGASRQDLQNLSGGTYSVTVTDSYGCAVSATVTIEEPLPFGCAIVSPSAMPVTGSSGNLLRTDIAGAAQYEWQVTGEGWVIDSGQGTSEITYTAGTSGSDPSATFTLIITYSNGCQETCSITVQNTGSEDPGDEDPGDEDPGDEDPGDEDPGDEDPGDEDPGDEDPGDEDPGDEDPGDEDPGDEDPGDEDPGDEDPGDEDPGDEDPGDEDPGDEDPGDEDPGDEDPGDEDPGDEDPGDEDPGDEDPGDEDPGDEDPGDEDPGDEDPGDEDPGNGSCVDCFETDIISSRSAGDCRTYTMKITSDGRCRYDLSHFTVAIPCGKVSDVSNSEGWNIEYGKDPTTGLYGFKVDDVPEFGKGHAGESFTVTFTLCPEDALCRNKLTCWEPIVAYKAGQCVFYDDLEAVCNDLNMRTNVNTEPVSAVAYPNPFVADATIEFAVEEDTYVTVELYSMYGRKVAVLFEGNAEKYLIHKVKIDGVRFKEDYYIYKIISSRGTYTGKIFRNQ